MNHTRKARSWSKWVTHCIMKLWKLSVRYLASSTQVPYCWSFSIANVVHHTYSHFPLHYSPNLVWSTRFIINPLNWIAIPKVGEPIMLTFMKLDFVWCVINPWQKLGRFTKLVHIQCHKIEIKVTKSQVLTHFKRNIYPIFLCNYAGVPRCWSSVENWCLGYHNHQADV